MQQIGDLIRRAARQFGSAPALVHGERTMSFVELDAATDRLGNAVLGAGLAPGDRVAVRLPNGIDAVVVFYALAKAGLVRVPLNVRETAGEHAEKVADAEARGMISDQPPPVDVDVAVEHGQLERMIAAAEARPCDVSRGLDEPLRLAYTGGTTGRPKAVVLTTRSELAEIANFLTDLTPDLRPDDVMLHAAPITHGSGAFFLPHLVKGACNVILDRFTPDGWLEAAQRHRATTSFMVPTMIAKVLEDPSAFDAPLALRRLCYGAAPIAPTLLQRALDAFGPVMAQLYGQAEAPLSITCLQPHEHTPDRLASAGRPYTFVEVDIRDADGASVPPGVAGEVMTRGPHTMREYWQRPEETAATIEPDGWLHTGDLGQWDDGGFLSLLDRKNDVIISGGFNVYPREVEDALMAHPHVTDVAVVGLPDQTWGEQVAAAVVTTRPIETDELTRYCADRLADFKRPRHLEIWSALPRSPVGKILRRDVRDQMGDRATVD